MIYHWAAKVCFSVDTKCEMSSYWIFWIIYYFVIHFCCLHSECNLIWLSKINSMSSVQQVNSRQNLIGSMRKSQQVSWDYDKLWWKFINNVASLGLVFQECDIFLLNVFIEITWCQPEVGNLATDSDSVTDLQQNPQQNLILWMESQVRFLL